MRLKLPDRFLQGLAAFTRMDEDSFNDLMKELKELSPALSPEKLEKEFALRRTQVSESESKRLFEILMSLCFLKENNPEEGDFESAVSKQVSELSVPEQDVLKVRLKEVLSDVTALELTAHALSVSADHDKVLVKCRILTDLRAVFFDDGTTANGAVVMHTLKLAYHQDGGQKNCYVGVDSRDMDELERAISRARRKESSIVAMLERAQVPAIQGE